MAGALWCVALAAAVRMRADAFNIDTGHAAVLEGPPGSYFGYSVALRGQGPVDASIVVGAPRANSTFPKDVAFVEPGAVYECKKSRMNWSCDVLDLGPSSLELNVANNKYSLSKDYAGYGAALHTRATGESPLVACGPGIKNFVGDNCFMNGICFIVMQNDFKTFKLPLISTNKQDYNSTTPFYAYGEAGMSVHLTEDGSEFLIGAPGVLRWRGTVIKYRMDNLKKNVIPNPNENTELGEDDYFGFSVSSGKFFSTDVLYVGGAPRSATLKGKVLVFSFPEDPSQPLHIHLKLLGRQMGEYFGSVLCVLDLNADGLDDLVVGAPRHSLRGSLSGDEGRIYVYLSHADGTMVEANYTAFTGSSCPGANFGASMASIGDINMDGYQDLAVGAPYEGSGAIYIYHGSPDGMRPQYAQRISADDVASRVTLSGFGMSISPGLDIDGNHYNDIAVGAYSSARAVVLRSRPVAHLHGNLTADVVMINLKDLAFNFTACVFFTGHFLPSELGIAVTLKVDPDLNRAIVNDQDNILQYIITVQNGMKDCRKFNVKIRVGGDDYFNPVYVSLNVSLQDSLTNDRTANSDFCQSCPVADISNRGVMISVLFDNGCGEDAVCQTNLAVYAELVDITTPYVLDPKIPLKVKVSVVSLKEPAYQSQITLETSGEVMLEKMLSSCQQLLGIPALHLKCTLGHRPLTEDSRSVVVVLELGVSKLSSSTEELVFNITAESSGVEQTPANNIALLSLRVFTDSQPILVGKPRPATLYFSQQTDDVMFTHVYEVRNSGPSPMAAVDLEFLVPTTAVVGGKSTQGVYIDGITGQIGTCRLNCTSQSRVAGEVAVVSGSDTTLQLSCEQRPDSCAVVTCWGVGPFPTTHSVAIISIYLRSPPAALASLIGQGKFIQISSVGRAKYLLPKNSIHFYRNSSEQGTLQAVATATSMLIADVATAKVEPWILLLAILAGFLTLLMIVLGLYKVGFFRRRCHNYGPLQEGTVTSNDGISATTSSRESIPLSHY